MMIRFYLIFVALTFIACNKSIDKEKYIQEVQNSEKYNKREERNNYIISVGIKPANYLALQEIRNIQNEKQQKESFMKSKESFKSGLYLDLKIGMKDGEKVVPSIVKTQQDYSFLIGQLNYLIQNDLYLLNEQNDTIKALSCNFSNTFNDGKNINLTFCFPINKIQKDKSDKLKVQYNDHVFGISERIDFVFSKDETINTNWTIKNIED